MMRFRNDGSQSPPVVAHTISANGWVIAPATRLILSLLISPVGSRMLLPNNVFFMLPSNNFLVPKWCPTLQNHNMRTCGKK